MLSSREKEHVRNILTLRYDPVETPTIPATNYKDWIPTIFETTAIQVERKIMSSLAKLEEFNKIGIALSSGIDSVLLLAMLRHLFPDKKLIAFHYEGINNEMENAKLFADAFDAEFVAIHNPTVLDKISWQVGITKEPMWDSFDYLLYEFAQARHCKVLVDGTGADELFGGYVFRYFNYNPTGVTTEAKFYGYMDVHNRDWVEDQAHLFGPELEFKWEMIKEHLVHNFGNPLPTLNQIMMADYNGKLIHLFAKKAKIFSNVYQTPNFAPYLDSQVTAYAMHLETSLKINGSCGKMPLRQIAARYDIAIPTGKMGFSHDVVKDWNSEHWQVANEDLTDPNNQIFVQGLINYEWVKRHSASETSRNDVRYVNKFMQLLALEEWLRRKNRL